MGGETYENSVADDLEIFFEDIQLGRSPVSIAWTYFSPELTPKEMELVEIKNQEYMRSFKMLNNADVNETEMTLSTSSSKYVSAYCRRRTITIDSQTFPGANQESNSDNDKKLTPTMHLTNSGKIKKLTDNKFEEMIRIEDSWSEDSWSEHSWSEDSWSSDPEEVTKLKFGTTRSNTVEFTKRKGWFCGLCRVPSCCRKLKDSASLPMKQFAAGKFRTQLNSEYNCCGIIVIAITIAIFLNIIILSILRKVMLPESNPV